MILIRHEINLQDLKASDRLPSPSNTALAIMRSTKSDDATARSVAELVQTDPALSGRILKFVNSAAISLRRPIISIQDAVQLLGMNAVGQFAISLSVIGRYRQGPCQNFEYSNYWSLALSRAVSLQAVSRMQPVTIPEEAFSLGLLADIGKLAMAALWPNVYSEILENTDAEQLLLMEEQQFAVNHRELSMLLLADWGFPSVFLDALKQPSCIDSQSYSRAGQLKNQLDFAECIAGYCLGDDPYRQQLDADLLRLGKSYGLWEPELKVFLMAIEQEWRNWGELIGVSTDIRLSLPNDDITSYKVEHAVEVLFVSDDQVKADNLANHIREIGFAVNLLPDANSAIAYYVDYNPGPVIIILYSDPLIWKATDIYQSLLNFAKEKSFYFIYLADNGDEAIIAEALECGADAFLYEPISPTVLKAHLAVGKRFVHTQRKSARTLAEIDRFNEELSATTQRLEVMANTDPLTSLPNRRYALACLEQEWATLMRYGRSFCVLLLDLDRFKLINDNLGHAVGDAVLIHVTKIMQKSIRINDILCRFGGEEFLVIAPETDRAAALVLAERIRAAIEQDQPPGLGTSMKITVSIGAASMIIKDEGWQNMLERADQAMYSIKIAGRNGVGFADCL